MKNETIKILQKQKKKILDMWMNFQLTDETLREDLMNNDELRMQSEDLVTALVDNLKDENIDTPDSPDFDSVTDILNGISISRAKQGYTSRETGIFVFSLKQALLVLLQQEIRDPQVLYDQSLKVNKLIDFFGVATFETFIKGREEVILRQTDEITEISTPVIQIWDGILALPIIGTLDSARTQVVMENLLQKIVETGSSIAILDISGVPAVDSLVAQHLIKTVSATRLMGAECIISGIRPEIAQTVVHLGIDLSGVITKASLASALKTAFGILQLQVTRKQKNPLIVE
ncbi:STAS domain-containing protein [Chryseolinea lacunae]|uniref:STAS domain-containing protein n=1 Tax=Chryseolinea lacunae TaxID=2801331 RepID=A0ABS1L2T0_9BACT|nr:STAS domain-containing protein [Chryseolinea lacunae]MBL0745853.1 STAS domain-containing protein [Chryseolinea lacunae]